MTLTMYHGTAYVHHAAVMRDGLKPAAHGGPYVTVNRQVARSYAIWCAQGHRGESGDRDAKGIVYTLRVPPDRVRRAAEVEGASHKDSMAYEVEGEWRLSPTYVVVGGVAHEWIVDQTHVNVPPDPTHDRHQAVGHRLAQAADSGGALQRQLAAAGYSPAQSKRMAAGLAFAMLDPSAIMGGMPNVALSGAVEAALAVLGGMR